MFGNPVDPTTGRVNGRTFSRMSRQCVIRSWKAPISMRWCSRTFRKDVYFAQGVNRVARWDGVSRKPPLKRWRWCIGQLQLGRTGSSYHHTHLRLQYRSQIIVQRRGRHGLNEAVDVRSGSGFVRRREILGNEDHVRKYRASATSPGTYG